MARCGRCGLWNKYTDEQKWAGVCARYQTRLMDDDVWEERTCPTFFERIPGMHAMDPDELGPVPGLSAMSPIEDSN